MSASATYEWLLDPIRRDEFEKTYYERALCVVHRNDPDYFAEVLRIEDLDDVLSSHLTAHPEVNLVSSQRDIPTSEYLDESSRIDPLAVGRLFEAGATVIFTHLHRRVPPLADFCSDLSSALSAPIQANIYFTPAGAQGFPAHWDTHDVFILQVSGSKKWTIYNTPIELPLRGQDFNPDVHKAGEVSREFELKPGDWAYLPRGLMHSAKSSEEASLHITVGVMAFTWADMFLEAVAAASMSDPRLREHLPAGFADQAAPTADFLRLYGERLAILADYMRANPPLASMAAEVAKKHKPMRRDVLKNLLNKDSFTLDTQVRRVGTPWQVSQEDGACIVDNGMREMRLPDFVAPAVEFLNSVDAARITEIPDCVDDDGKLTLVRRLSQDGFIELIGAASPAEPQPVA